LNCRDARQLIDRGAEPGSTNSVRATLGFHLANCASCRAYRQRAHEHLLANLLFDAAPRQREQRYTTTRLPVAPPPWRRAMVVSLAVVCTLLALVAGRVAVAAFSIQRNVQAYIVPTPTAGAAPATSQPALVVPIDTATPLVASSDPAPVAAQIDDQELPAPTARPSPTSQPVPIVPTPAGAAPLIPTLQAITPTPVMPIAGSAVNILLLGIDRRPGETDPSRSDSIIIAHVDPDRHRVALLSLPRDLIVSIPGYGYSRINAAHVYGDLYPDLGGGIALARQTVGQLLGTPIDYAVQIDFEGFIGLIDSIGGIDVDIPTALYDGQYPTMDYNYMEVYFDPGLQHLDGSRALQYARIRHGDSDFERARRQQQGIVAVVHRLRDQNPLQLLDSATAVSASLRGYLWTDLPQDRMIGLAWALRDMRPEQIERYVVDENMVSFNGVSGACSSADDYWAECLDQAALQALVQQWLGQ
jgi:LCP family protein required for cell wall assembly